MQLFENLKISSPNTNCYHITPYRNQIWVFTYDKYNIIYTYQTKLANIKSQIVPEVPVEKPIVTKVDLATKFDNADALLINTPVQLPQFKSINYTNFFKFKKNLYIWLYYCNYGFCVFALFAWLIFILGWVGFLTYQLEEYLGFGFLNSIITIAIGAAGLFICLIYNIVLNTMFMQEINKNADYLMKKNAKLLLSWHWVPFLNVRYNAKVLATIKTFIFSNTTFVLTHNVNWQEALF